MTKTLKILSFIDCVLHGGGGGGGVGTGGNKFWLLYLQEACVFPLGPLSLN